MKSPPKNHTLPSIFGLISSCTENQNISMKQFLCDLNLSENHEEVQATSQQTNQTNIHKTVSKSKWNQNEDELLIAAVEKYGTKNWKLVSTMVPNRNGKQCRERWNSHIDPTLSNTKWSSTEDFRLLELQHKYGNRWSYISLFLPGRSGNSIKNRYLFLVRKNRQMNAALRSDLPLFSFEQVNDSSMNNFTHFQPNLSNSRQFQY